jgi:hypothetical protein
MKLDLNELAALKMILEFVPVKELISSAMKNFAEQDTVQSMQHLLLKPHTADVRSAQPQTAYSQTF